ncbi:MAG: DoxX family protein [Candidatus Omnitrophota bacterium]|nr:DoxX family protein [Candidatus Omnitrophota bacterium]
MCKKLLSTDADISAFILRLMLGIVFFPHGAQKVLGWFGGHGLSATLAAFTDKMHIPFIFALLAVMAESIGAVALIIGFFTRLAALGIAVVMAVAIYMVHGRFGFFMNWSGAQKGEGIEYHLLAMAIAITLIIKGAGSFSIDRKISKKL